MGDDLLTVRRRSRIHIEGRFVDYPIRLGQAVGAFGVAKAAGIAASYAKALLDGHDGEAVSFEDWVERRFGRIALRDLLQALHREGLGHSVRPTFRPTGRRSASACRA